LASHRNGDNAKSSVFTLQSVFFIQAMMVCITFIGASLAG